MSRQTIESYATQALSCSEQMFILAEKQDWEALSKLEQERAMLLENMFEHPAMPGLLIHVANTIRHIIELDQKTIALGKQAHQCLKNEMELLTQGRRAVGAYLDTQSFPQ